MKKKNKFET